MGSGKKKTSSKKKSPSRRSNPSPAENAKDITLPPVVGIGASAGGLEAFKQFFSAMPSDTGSAFVLVQHLDPKHESMMVELLSKYTAMPVHQIKDGMPIEPNHIYIIPPNHYVELAGKQLKLCDPIKQRGMRMPIDYFFRSLANECEERAICIVLSGTGSDGALGLKAVKAAGGMTMAEDPDSASYNGMPRAAINTGLVDFVLSVDEMPRKLERYIHHPYIADGDSAALVENAPEDHFKAILSLLRARTDYDFRSYKKGTLTRRIERRLGLNHLDKLADYVTLLRTDSDEVHRLFRDLLIGVTSFFRDRDSWDFLEKEILSKLVAEKHFDEPVRVWICGCTTGEEAYSIAMILSEQFAAAKKNYNAQIFATDINEEAITQARLGRYSGNIAADLTPQRLNHFFTDDGDEFVVKKKLRESVVFAVQNLISDPPFSKLDLICCRNVLIYLEGEVQNRIIEMFNFALRDGGYLFLGNSESIGNYADYYKPISKKCRIYQKAAQLSRRKSNFPIYSAEERGRGKTPGPDGPHPTQGMAETARSLLLDHFAPASILINRDYQAIYFHGATRQYLDYPSGEPTRDLSALCFEGLRNKLRATVQKSATEGKRATSIARRVKRNGDHVSVRITVDPVPQQQRGEDLFIVTFEDESECPPPPQINVELPGEETEMVAQMQVELQTTKEDLQSTIEELETSNEELQASNEEVMSMNEELQSTNEELETSREELQSLNEELSTVNNQLEEKVKEVEATNNDLINLLSSTEIATIFLDTEFKIRRFTPATKTLINLINSDIGRPFSDIALRFTDEHLLEDATAVLERLTPIEREIRNDGNHAYIRRIVPYRTQENRIEGVVITFTDITPIRDQADLLHVREQQQAAVADLGRIALSDDNLDELFERVCQEMSRVLDVPLVKLLQLQPEKKSLIIRAGVGWDENVIAGETTVSAGRKSQAGFTLQSQTPIIVANLPEDKRFSGPALLTDHGVISGFSVIIGPDEKPWGVLGAHHTIQREFTGDDVNFLQSVANLLYESIKRNELVKHHRTIINSVSEAFILLDEDWRYAFANAQAIQFLRKERDELIGNVVWEIFPDLINSPFETAMRAARETGEMFEVVEYYPPHQSWYEARCYPSENGGISVMFNDVTQKRSNERRLRLALESGRIGVWEQNVETGHATFDERVCELIGFEPGTPGCHVDDFLDRVHPDDRDDVAAYIDQLLDEAATGSNEFRVVLPSGEHRWLASRGMVVRNADGEPVLITGMNWDITEQKLAEQRLAEANEELERNVEERTQELRILSENVPAWFSFIDRDLRYRFVNRKYREVFKKEAEEIIGCRVEEIMPADFYQEITPRLKACLEGEEQIFEIVLNFPGDTPLFSRVHYVPRQELDGSISGIFVLADDITEERRLQEEVLDAADREKDRIGRDLHDSICQELGGIGMFAHALAQSLSRRKAEESKDAETLIRQIEEVTQSARKLARGLSLAALEDDRPLAHALRNLAENIDDLHKGVACEFTTNMPEEELPPRAANQLFYIAREAAFNALRHGDPRTISIELKKLRRAVLVAVDDDGGGRIETLAEGLGIRSMRYRATAIGASLTLKNNREGDGLLVTCRMPLLRAPAD